MQNLPPSTSQVPEQELSAEEWLRKVHEGPCCADPKDKDLDENRCGGLHRSKA